MKTLLIILFVFTASLTAYGQPKWIVYNTGNSGLPSNAISTIAIEKGNIIWIGNGSGLTKFDGVNWTVYNDTNSGLPHNTVRTIKIDSLGNKWIATFGGGLAKFDNTNWTVYNTSNSGIASDVLLSLAIDKNDNKYVGSTQISKFDNTIWTVYDTNSGLPFGVYLTISVEKNNSKWIGLQSHGLIKFQDTSFVIYNTSNSGLPNNHVNVIDFDVNGDKWIGTTFGGIAKFDDTNNIWQVYDNSNSGFPPQSNTARTLLVDSLSLWIGTSGFAGGFVKFFNDTNWIVYTPQNSPLPSENLRVISKDSNNNLWIGTAQGLAVFNENGIVSVNNQLMVVPHNYVLYQNYPNPFNPTTKIHYELKITNYAKLTVHDVTGKAVRTLVNERQQTGVYEYEFNGSGLSSGIYFYSLEVNGELIDTKKMVALK